MDDDRHNQVPTTNPARVLLVEDNVNNRKVVQIMLLRLGIEPDIAEDGAAAVSACEAADYDLILMDIQLPGVDGYETTRRIKKNPKPRLIPIIAVTSYALPGDEAKAIEAGCDGYMSKPFRRRDLLARVREHLP